MSVAVCESGIDDIEDAPPISIDTRNPRTDVQPLAVSDHVAPDVDEETRRRVPGAQAIYVKTFGCSHNQSDSEYMMGILQSYGYRYACRGLFTLTPSPDTLSTSASRAPSPLIHVSAPLQTHYRRRCRKPAVRRSVGDQQLHSEESQPVPDGYSYQ